MAQSTYPVTVIKPFDQKEIDAIAAPFVDLANVVYGQKEALTAKQKAIRNREATARTTAYAGLNKIKGIDYSTYDDNMRAFFDGKVDDYVAIANGVDAGSINAKEGARSMAYISGMIDEYQNLAPKVLAQAKFMMEHGAGGTNTLSKLNDPNLEIMFSKLLEGSGEVTLAEDGNGRMYLKGEGKLDGQDWNYNLNLSEFDKLDAQGDSLAITTISGDELGIDTVSETASAGTILTEAKDNGTSIEYTNIDTMRQNLMGPFSNAVTQVISNENFGSYWADVMYKDKDVDYLTDNDMLWDPANEDKMGEAKEFIINQMIDKIPKEQQIQFSERDKDGKFNPTSELEGASPGTTFGKKRKVAKQPKPRNLTVAERNTETQSNTLSQIFKGQGKLLQNPAKLLDFINGSPSSFSFKMGEGFNNKDSRIQSVSNYVTYLKENYVDKKGVDLGVGSQKLYDILKEIEKQGNGDKVIGFKEDGFPIGKFPYVMNNKTAIYNILKLTPTFEDLTISEIQNLVTGITNGYNKEQELLNEFAPKVNTGRGTGGGR